MSSPPQLIDQNFMRHAIEIPQQRAHMNVHQSPNLAMANSGLNCDTFNIIHILDGKKISKVELQAVIDNFLHHHLSFCIWVNNENLTPHLRQIFTDLSMICQGEEVGIMLDLHAYECIEVPKHEHITQVKNTSKLKDYARVIASNWRPPDDNILEYYKLTAAQYLSNPEIMLLLYYQENKPVATVEMFPSDGKTMGIYGLATLEDSRGMGIGSALMTKALNEAKRLNYQQVVLQASEDGLGIYKKLGFRPYTKYYEFVLEK